MGGQWEKIMQVLDMKKFWKHYHKVCQLLLTLKPGLQLMSFIVLPRLQGESAVEKYTVNALIGSHYKDKDYTKFNMFRKG